MGMTTVSLTVAALAALLSGQGTADQQAYAIYQARLATLVSPTGTGSTSAIPDASAPPAAPASTASTTGCLLVPGGSNLATTGDCTACHFNYARGHSHPVDVYQDSLRSRSLRPSAEVVKRGVFLADGKVSCLSCHDGNSSWKYKIALPPGAATRPRVKPGDPQTYGQGMIVRVATTMPAGSDVSPAPLCKVCHAFD
jgi:hypothetical protein